VAERQPLGDRRYPPHFLLLLAYFNRRWLAVHLLFFDSLPLSTEINSNAHHLLPASAVQYSQSYTDVYAFNPIYGSFLLHAERHNDNMVFSNIISKPLYYHR
jgi:hypothetical protein